MQPVHPTTTRIASGLERDTELVPASDPRSAFLSIDPERRGGVPCFAGTRVPVQDLWDCLADNGSLDEFLDSFPTVSHEQAVQAIQMAGQRLLDGLPPTVKILFDEDAPRPLRRHLVGHSVSTVQEMGWAGVKNGKLLVLAEDQAFDVLLTFDRNLPYQQNRDGRVIEVVVVIAPNKRMTTLVPRVPDILAVLQTVRPGQVYHVA